MLHANIPDNFFDFGETGLDGKACKLIFTKMDDDVCGRFLGNAIVGHQFSETTAAHEGRTVNTVGNILSQVIRNPKRLRQMLMHSKAMIMLHDVSDVLKEVIVASTETDPVLKAQCATQLREYDLTITPFMYQLALFSNASNAPSLFGVTVDELRKSLLIEEQIGRGFSMPEAIKFCEDAVKLVNETVEDFEKCALWDTPEVADKISVMMQYYNEIEQTISFAGLQNQIHEKCDGTEYACTISTYKNQHGLTPTHAHVQGAVLNRINGRYEKNLHNLIIAANDKPQQLAMAVCTIQHCYNVSKTVYSLSKPHLSLKDISNEPGENDAMMLHQQFNAQQKDLFAQGHPDIIENTSLVDLYGRAMFDLAKKGICTLPENGKTLAESNNPTKIFLGRRSHKLAASYLQSFFPNSF